MVWSLCFADKNLTLHYKVNETVRLEVYNIVLARNDPGLSAVGAEQDRFKF